jgi:hypothetical protein
MEYQTEEGFEEITTEDTANWWISTYIRPENTALLVDLINPLTGTVEAIEYKDMHSILYAPEAISM